MEIEYELDESDLVMLARFQANRSQIARRRFKARWIGYSLGIGLIGLGAYLVFSNFTLLLSISGCTALFFIIYPSYFRRAFERRIRQLVHERATAASFAKRTLRATPEGLEQVMQASESKVTWELVDGIEVTPPHAFISIDGTYSVVIPRYRLGEDQFNGFLETVRKHTRAATN
jgi:hypothetical protein